MSKQRLISEDYYVFLMMIYDDVGGVDDMDSLLWLC